MTRLLNIILLSIAVTGCASTMTERLAGNLSQGILNQNDPKTVQAGAPALLLFLDGLIENEPDSPALLRAGATLRGAYATTFVSDPQRARRMADKARDYARRALCQRHPDVCATDSGAYDAFAAAIADIHKGDVPNLYTYGATWAGWVQTRLDDWNARADLPKIDAVMRRVVELDETYEWGRAHLYLGVINSQLPPLLGGKPEEGRAHFERAIELSQGRDLIAKVEFARSYTRLLFDQTLHDRLLNEVLAADPEVLGLTLSNTLAQEQARLLLASSAEYFEE